MSFETDSFILNAMGFKNSVEAFQYDTSDVIFEDLCRSEEALNNLYMAIDFSNKLSADKVRMLQKIKRNYCDNRCKNKIARTSMESYLDKSIEGVGTLIVGIMLLPTVIKLLKSVVKFIIKTITWIASKILSLIKTLIGKLIPISNSKKREKRIVDEFFKKFHSESAESLDLSREDEDMNSIKNNPDLYVSLARYTKQFIKTNKDIQNMTPEELLFYKVFLIDGNPKNIKYVYDSFNRSTSRIRDVGSNLNKVGSRLMIDCRPTASSSRESLDQSLENEEISESRKEELERLGDILIKSGIVDLKHTDTNKDFATMLKGIQYSLYNGEDILWMKKFYYILNNGHSELKVISKEIGSKLDYLEKLDEKKLSKDAKSNISIYGTEVREFQRFLASYNKCIQYFIKYYKIRTDIIGRFSYSVDKAYGGYAA